MGKLVLQNLIRHPVRSLLTAGAVSVAIFLVCFLRSVVTTLTAGLEAASATRLVVMSSISLFVELPLTYQDKIASVEGIDDIVKWQWFGGYYQDRKNFFAQFAVDPERMLEVYPECQLDAAEREAFLTRKDVCVVGYQLADKFGWKVGDRIPLIGALFPHPSGGAWEFELVGTYESTSASFDNQTFMFPWDYFEETLRAAGNDPGVGVFVMSVGPGADVERIIADVETLFENGPQTIKCETESEFTRQFMTMLGDIPMFLTWIGTGVLVAILLGAVNSMLMAGREQVHDVGIFKALGFTDGAAFRLLIAQSMTLCALGGLVGLALAWFSQEAVERMLGASFPNYHVQPETLLGATVITLALGVLSGLLPALRALRMSCVEALRATV